MVKSRRSFLFNAGVGMFGIGTAPRWLERAAFGATSGSRRNKILVATFQRGAADGLNIVVPHGDSHYFSLRPTIAVPKKTATIAPEDAAIDLDGFFGLNPALAPFKSLYDDRHLAIVAAAGSPDPSRSHFDAQDFMESGTPGVKGTTDGWLNRALPQAESKASAVRAVSIGANLPRTLLGAQEAIALETLGNFQIRDEATMGAMHTLYLESSDTALKGVGKEAFEAEALLKSVQKQTYVPANGVKYPRTKFGQSMQQIAQLIKADIGVEVAFAESLGWDTHVAEVGTRASIGTLPGLLREFSQAISGFHNDMGDRMSDIVLVTMSEFGRTARENGNRGTDHGHANVMFVLGGDVRGGKVYGTWPGLSDEQLNEQRDLALTTDFRAVLGELACNHLGSHALKSVFPGYEGSAADFRGVLRA